MPTACRLSQTLAHLSVPSFNTPPSIASLASHAHAPGGFVPWQCSVRSQAQATYGAVLEALRSSRASAGLAFVHARAKLHRMRALHPCSGRSQMANPSFKRTANGLRARRLPLKSNVRRQHIVLRSLEGKVPIHASIVEYENQAPTDRKRDGQ